VGISGQAFLVQCWNMPQKALPCHEGNPEVAKELERLYAQLSAVEALIRALEVYRQFYPRLVRPKIRTA
jgi:hypothetical protein